LLPQVQPEKLSLYRLGLKSFFEEGRSLAQISHASVVSVLNFLPRERDRIHGHELPGGRDPAGFHHHGARPQEAEGLSRIHHSQPV
jgi:hypothetical protein